MAIRGKPSLKSQREKDATCRGLVTGWPLLVMLMVATAGQFDTLGSPYLQTQTTFVGEVELPRSLNISSSPLHQHRTDNSYVPSKIESYFLEHGKELGLDSRRTPSSGCSTWRDPNSPIVAELRAFRKELKAYHAALETFLQGNRTVKDLRKEIMAKGDYSICDSLELHPHGLKGLFPSQSLTQTSQSLLEPIFPPMRSPKLCFAPPRGHVILSMDYLVHDFAAYCRTLTPTSRVVLLDMGASLDFHTVGLQPAVYMTEIYGKFGFHFDHIYAYEITPKNPGDVVDKVPDGLAPAYHWINVGVDPDPTSKRNPWRMLRQEYDETDFVIVKLDIDTPHIEMALVQQLIQSPELIKLVDVFYFEHHVYMKELARSWRRTMKGSVLSSLELFASLRQKGVDAHFWV